MTTWLQEVKYDPIQPLLASNNPAILYFATRDLLNKPVQPIQYIWELPEVQKILTKQQPDGTWKYTGSKRDLYPLHHYPLVMTFKQFRTLVNRYELTRSHPGCAQAAEFLFSCQTPEGDIRGMIGNQYATYYTGTIIALLIKAGYSEDPRIEQGFQWLLRMRQNDGGWTIPILTHTFDGKTSIKLTSEHVPPVEPDRTKPFSHNWTDMVLRAFAAHPTYKASPEAKQAGNLLKSRFFQKDVYSSYEAESYWVRFEFWWSNILTSLESLFHLGFTSDDPDIKRGLDWLVTHQQKNGLWKHNYAPSKKTTMSTTHVKRQLWVSLRMCRVLKNYFDE